MGASTPADTLQHGVVRDLKRVRSLSIGGSSVKGASQGVLWGRIHHLRKGWCGDRVMNNFSILAFATADFVLKVVYGAFASVTRQLSQKRLVVVVRRRLVHDNLCFLWAQREDDKFGPLAQLQVVECGQGLAGNGCSVGLVWGVWLSMHFHYREWFFEDCDRSRDGSFVCNQISVSLQALDLPLIAGILWTRLPSLSESRKFRGQKINSLQKQIMSSLQALEPPPGRVLARTKRQFYACVSTSTRRPIRG